MKKTYVVKLIISMIFTLSVLTVFFPNAKPLLEKIENKKTIIQIIALGDSLTEGVGISEDETGFVEYLATLLENEVNSVIIEQNNYGKSGDKVRQLINKISEDKDLQNNLRKADIITITIGGNDLMKVFRDNIFNNLSSEIIDTNKKIYLRDLKELYSLIRKSSESPIYHLGVYNPFYLHFNEIDGFQKSVEEWNNQTEEFIQNQTNVYFIPINDLLYKGTGFNYENVKINDLLSSEDDFHPNVTGYQIIAREFKNKILETRFKNEKS